MVRRFTTEAAASALTAQAALAKTPGISHRVRVDLLIAAIAATSNIGVLHYDHDELWPDFTRESLKRVLAEYSTRRDAWTQRSILVPRRPRRQVRTS